MATEFAEVRRNAADEYAEKGLNGEYYDVADRANLHAYAQVQATIYLGDQVKRLADATSAIADGMGALADSARDTATSLEGINQGGSAR